MTAPAQIAFTRDGRRAGIRAHGRVVWLPDDFTAPMRELQAVMDLTNRQLDAYHALWAECEAEAIDRLARGVSVSA